MALVVGALRRGGRGEKSTLWPSHFVMQKGPKGWQISNIRWHRGAGEPFSTTRTSTTWERCIGRYAFAGRGVRRRSQRLDCQRWGASGPVPAAPGEHVLDYERTLQVADFAPDGQQMLTGSSESLPALTTVFALVYQVEWHICPVACACQGCARRVGEWKDMSKFTPPILEVYPAILLRPLGVSLVLFGIIPFFTAPEKVVLGMALIVCGLLLALISTHRRTLEVTPDGDLVDFAHWLLGPSRLVRRQRLVGCPVTVEAEVVSKDDVTVFWLVEVADRTVWQFKGQSEAEALARQLEAAGGVPQRGSE